MASAELVRMWAVLLEIFWITFSKYVSREGMKKYLPARNSKKNTQQQLQTLQCLTPKFI
jgi:hypothetical protein